MYIDSVKKRQYDWETEEDARTLQRMAEIKSDPKRLSKAQSCLSDYVETLTKALPSNSDSVYIPSRFNNPATVGKLPYPK